jgi:hypothetical protein
VQPSPESLSTPDIQPGGCSDCGRQWSAHSEAHCPTCHEHFASDRAFDCHLNARADTDVTQPACLDPASIRNLYLVQRASGPAWSTGPPSAMQESGFQRVLGREVAHG